MDIYEAKANYERLKDKLAKALGSRRYFNRYKRCHRRRN